jgi:inositol hexakisphosphate/diphosphoinositol-pentakisphosphate kinase
MLRACSELDYLTHLVFRLYENMAVPADHPERFRIEILFCPGTAFDPTEVNILRTCSVGCAVEYSCCCRDDA